MQLPTQSNEPSSNVIQLKNPATHHAHSHTHTHTHNQPNPSPIRTNHPQPALSQLSLGARRTSFVAHSLRPACLRPFFSSSALYWFSFSFRSFPIHTADLHLAVLFSLSISFRSVSSFRSWQRTLLQALLLLYNIRSSFITTHWLFWLRGPDS